MSPDERLVLFGTHDFFIYSAAFNVKSKQLRLVGTKQMSEHPSWLTRHPTHKDIVYCNGHVEGKVFCLQVGPDGAVVVLDEAVAGGVGPTHLALNQDHTGLLIAHYGQETKGLLAELPLSPEGRFLLDATDPTTHFHPKHQKWTHPRLDEPHVHHVMTRGNEVLACDLGTNKVWRLRRGDSTKGEDAWVVNGAVQDGLADGDGPRHAAIHPEHEIIYVLNEVSSSLTVHSLPKDAEPELLQRFSILPPEGEERKEDMTAAEILLLPPLDPRAPSLLLCTNRYTTREEGDAIALFAVGADGTVQRTETGWYRGVGKHVRALDGDKTGRFIATAARDGGGVVILERVGDGTEVVEVARLSDVENVVDALWMD